MSVNLPDLHQILASGDRAGWACLASDILDFEVSADLVEEAMKSGEFQRFFIAHVVHLSKAREQRLKRL